MSEATPEPLERTIERPCAACAYGEHWECPLPVVGDDQDWWACCCEVDEAAP
jgi:hypothetical protein